MFLLAAFCDNNRLIFGRPGLTCGNMRFLRIIWEKYQKQKSGLTGCLWIYRLCWHSHPLFVEKNAEKSGLNGATSPFLDRFCCKMQPRGLFMSIYVYFRSILAAVWVRCIALSSDLSWSNACDDRRASDRKRGVQRRPTAVWFLRFHHFSRTFSPPKCWILA